MALRATKGDGNLARAHFSHEYTDAADCWNVARVASAESGFSTEPTVSRKFVRQSAAVN